MKLQLLTDYQGQLIDGWLVSEKRDGHRIFWDGSLLWTRGGHLLNPPDWFVAGLPNMPLDGELFASRGGFNEIPSRINSDWSGLTFEIFDTPQAGTFKQRLRLLKSLSLPPHAHVLEQSVCRDTQHLIELADAICDAGGEGVVVRDPKAPYVAGRSDSALRWVPRPPIENRRKSA